MKILQVITSLQIGGAEHVVVHLTKLLRQKDHTVDVIVFNGEHTAFMRELEETGCRIYKFGRGFYNLSYIPKLRRIMQEYDIIHTHNSSPQLFAAIANIGLGKVLITTEHSTNNRKREHPMFSFVDKWMYGKYAKVVTISRIAEDKLCNYLGISTNQTGDSLRDKITTINNGVDVNAFYHVEDLPDLDHQGKFVTVMVAGYREAKDQETVIRAIALLPDEYELWLVGDGVRRPEIEAEIVKQNVTERVKLLGIRSDVPQILKSADVIVMSSHWEGLSLSNIEGMSSGKPFVASEVNGLKEVTAGYGILFPHGDAETLADVIKKLHDDSEYYRQVADRCYQRALQYDIRKMVDAYEQLYDAVQQ
ncbi:glycosyltransferase [Hoylesella buccalis]|uniref:Polysaccharide biosynthesis protein n=1 Tax=Hoylesella buccalis DNF00853 TaxID=1401074 RepID=A0A095ZPM0_9BACT|nr:glycosyltransferase [Hoylesella buccalis]KGF36663.1 polysaccharide biosynthesis protein [Hoylesella buccalis DNF00853]